MAAGKFSKTLYPTLLGLLLTGIMLWLQFSTSPLIQQTMQRLDSMVYDLRLKTMLPQHAPDKRIVIVDIDEKSLQEEGHWPWSRDRLGALVDRLFEAGAVVVGFDVVFAEAERNSGEAVLQRLRSTGNADAALMRQLGERLALFDNNLQFADKLQGRKVVLGYIFERKAAGTSGTLPQALVLEDPEALQRMALPAIDNYTGNIDIIQRAVRYGGFFTLDPDADGIIRRAPIVVRHGEALYPSLALEVARLYLDVEQVQLHTALVGESEVLEALSVGGRIIPTDSEGRVVIPYHGLWGSYPYVSASDVLNQRVPADRLANAIVLIGTTAQGLFDMRATPVQAVFPGVEVHANIIASILDGDFSLEPGWAAGADFLLTLLLGVILSLLFPRLTPLYLVIAVVVVLTLIIGFNFWVWSQSGLILALASQVVLVLTLTVFNMAYGFIGEFRGKRQLQGMFGQYVPHALVKEMSENPERYGFEGESREMTVLFADIRSFTTISESLNANELKRLLNRFFTPMTRIIFDKRGTIDKYVGDMLMAFWGAPVIDPQHAVHAIDAALAMQQEVDRLRQEFSKAGFPVFEIGIGINSGMMNVGDMGSEYRRAYTVLGDAVNLASRLEGATRHYQCGVLIGETTRKLAGDAFLYRELDVIRVKGKSIPVRIFEPLCRREQASETLRAEIAQHEAALRHYRLQEWDEAESIFRGLHEAHPETGIYALYMQRCDELSMQSVPSDWDGVYTFNEK